MEYNDLFIFEIDSTIYTVLSRLHDAGLLNELGLFWPKGVDFFRIIDAGNLPSYYNRNDHIVLCITDKKKWMLARIKYGF